MKAPELTPVEKRVKLGPYQGLTFFTEDDADFFFGRDRWRDVIIANLRARRLTVLYGPSGVGKSSLLRAGVVTRLDELARENGALQFVPVYFNSWQTDPIAGLSTAIRDKVLEFAGTELPESGDLTSLIHAAKDQTGVPLLIVLDQFEDYWTYAGPSARDPISTTNGDIVSDDFGLQMAKTINSEASVKILVSLREDALAQLDRTFRLGVARLLDHRLSLTPLSREEGELAIRKPLGRFSELVGADPPLDIEDRLVAAVLNEVRVGRVSAGKASPAAPGNGSHESDAIEAPYLQLVMRKIWERESARGSHTLHAQTLAEFGGADEIVATHIENALRDRSEDEKDAIADLLRYLVSPSHTKIAWTTEDLARFTSRSQEQVGALLAVLADPDRRIVRPVGDGGKTRYEIFHDVLGEPLLDWATERERVRAEREKKKRLKAEHERKRARIAAIGLLVAVLGALIAIAVISINNADAQHATAQSEQLAARAVQISDVGLASLYALESYRISHTEDARSAILQVAGSHELGTPLATRDGGISAVAWSPDRTTLATGGSDGVMRLWDSRTHRLLAQSPRPALQAALRSVAHLGIVGSNIGAVAFSRDGTLLAYAQNIEFFNAPLGILTVLGRVYVWDAHTHQQLMVLPGRTSRINALAFSPDGRQLASADGMLDTSFTDYTVRLWNLFGGVREKVLKGHTGPVNSVTFSPNGKLIASSSCDEGDHDNHSDTHDHGVVLYSVRTGRVVRLHAASPICDVAFSPDGKTLAAAGDDHSATLWDVARRAPIEPPFVGHSDVLNAVAFSPDGSTLATASRDHSVRLWDVQSHRQLGSPLTTIGGVNALAFNPDGKTVASGSSDGARVFKVVGPYEMGVLPTSPGRPALDVAISPDSRLLAWSDDAPRKPAEDVPAARASKRPQLGGTVYIWDTRARRMLDVIPAPADNINSLAFGPGGRTLVWAAQDDQSVWVWNVWRHALRERILPVPSPTPATLIERVAVSPDGSRIAFAEMVGERSTIEIWDDTHRRLVSLPLGKVGGLGALAFSPDGKLLASAGFDGTVRLWDVVHDRQVAALEGRTSAGGVTSPFSLAFSPDGKTLVSGGGDGAIMFWDVHSHREIGAPLTQHTSAVYGLAFSHDGKTLASASLDGTVRLWDVSSKRGLLVLEGHTSYVFGVAFSSNGRMIASAGGDAVRLWGNISLQSAIDRLCTYINTRTASAVWHQLEPSIGYRSPCS